ncbi:unnamed protein product [Boreogadus saida]
MSCERLAGRPSPQTRETVPPDPGDRPPRPGRPSPQTRALALLLLTDGEQRAARRPRALRDQRGAAAHRSPWLWAGTFCSPALQTPTGSSAPGAHITEGSHAMFQNIPLPGETGSLGRTELLDPELLHPDLGPTVCVRPGGTPSNGHLTRDTKTEGGPQHGADTKTEGGPQQAADTKTEGGPQQAAETLRLRGDPNTVQRLRLRGDPNTVQRLRLRGDPNTVQTLRLRGDPNTVQTLRLRGDPNTVQRH